MRAVLSIASVALLAACATNMDPSITQPGLKREVRNGEWLVEYFDPMNWPWAKSTAQSLTKDDVRKASGSDKAFLARGGIAITAPRGTKEARTKPASQPGHHLDKLMGNSL